MSKAAMGNDRVKSWDAEYWDAVRANDLVALKKLLERSPRLIHERIRGVAWNPGHVYDAETQKMVPAVDDFPFTNTALHVAAVNAWPEMVGLLLAKGADPNAIGFEDNKGLTPPVVLAAWEGCLKTLHALLVGGADPNLPASAETALYTAAEHDDEAKVKLLLKHEARHDIFTAAIVGDVDCVRRFLLSSSSLREARSLKRGRTAKEEAHHHGRTEVVHLF